MGKVHLLRITTVNGQRIINLAITLCGISARSGGGSVRVVEGVTCKRCLDSVDGDENYKEEMEVV